MSKPTHPFAPILLAIIVATAFGVLYKLFGVGRTIYEFAIGAILLYGGAFVLTMAVAAVGYAIVYIVRAVNRHPK